MTSVSKYNFSEIVDNIIPQTLFTLPLLKANILTEEYFRGGEGWAEDPQSSCLS